MYMFATPIPMPDKMDRIFMMKIGLRLRTEVEKKNRETRIGTRIEEPIVTMRRGTSRTYYIG